MFEILEPIPENLRDEAGQIYYEAFRRKLAPLIGAPRAVQRVLTAGLNLKMALGAQVDGCLLGLAGLHSQAGLFSTASMGSCLHQLGLLRGLYACAVINLFARGMHCPPGELRIAALAVTVRARGQGLGTRLLEAVCDRARREGCHSVRLEVVDTNHAARRLYERCGFRVIATQYYPIPSGWLGFKGDHVMVKKM